MHGHIGIGCCRHFKMPSSDFAGEQRSYLAYNCTLNSSTNHPASLFAIFSGLNPPRRNIFSFQHTRLISLASTVMSLTLFIVVYARNNNNDNNKSLQINKKKKEYVYKLYKGVYLIIYWKNIQKHVETTLIANCSSVNILWTSFDVLR